MATNKNTIRYIDEKTAQVTKAFQKNGHGISRPAYHPTAAWHF